MYILIDIGGTKTRVAVTRDGETFAPPSVFATPQNFDTWLALLHSHVSTITTDGSLRGIIIGLPGTFSENGIITKTPNLPLWQHVHLKEHIMQLTKVPVFLYNDTALVGLGEAVHGAGKEHSIVAYLTISTGVNGVRIVDGKIDRSTYGFEIGHTIVDIENEKDVESFISGGSLERRFGKPSHEVKDAMLWEKISRYAGIFGANTTMYWSPSIVIYGGPVMNDLHLDTITKEAKRHLTMYKDHPLFVRGTLQDFGGLYGALTVAKERLSL